MGREEIRAMGDCDQEHPVSNEGSHRGQGVEERGRHHIQKKRRGTASPSSGHTRKLDLQLALIEMTPCL